MKSKKKRIKEFLSKPRRLKNNTPEGKETFMRDMYEAQRLTNGTLSLSQKVNLMVELGAHKAVPGAPNNRRKAKKFFRKHLIQIAVDKVMAHLEEVA